MALRCRQVGLHFSGQSTRSRQAHCLFPFMHFMHFMPVMNVKADVLWLAMMLDLRRWLIVVVMWPVVMVFVIIMTMMGMTMVIVALARFGQDHGTHPIHRQTENRNPDRLTMHNGLGLINSL